MLVVKALMRDRDKQSDLDFFKLRLRSRGREIALIRSFVLIVQNLE